jgi:hypothetical protein
MKLEIIIAAQNVHEHESIGWVDFSHPAQNQFKKQRKIGHLVDGLKKKPDNFSTTNQELKRNYGWTNPTS